MDDTRFRILVRASVFCVLRNFQAGSGAHRFLVSMYCPSSPGIKRRRREANHSLPTVAEVMLLSKKVPLVLRFQLNEHQKVKAVRVSGTDSTVKIGLVAVQIGTALLVKVSVFRDVV